MVRRKGNSFQKGPKYLVTSPHDGNQSNNAQNRAQLQLIQELEDFFRGILDADVILDVLEDFHYDKERSTEALISMCPHYESSATPTPEILTASQGRVEQQPKFPENAGETVYFVKLRRGNKHFLNRYLAHKSPCTQASAPGTTCLRNANCR